MISFFDHEEKQILGQAENFHNALTHLKYEGKVRRQKNIKAAQKSIGQLLHTLRRHRGLQEAIIFPFLLVHIPKHESVIRFLRSDHEDIQQKKSKLRLWLLKISKNSKVTGVEGKIQQIGTYLVCLLQHHVQLEKENIHKAIRKELRLDEKRDIAARIRRWLHKYRNGKKQG